MNGIDYRHCPPSGVAVYWRFIKKSPGPYRYGFVTYIRDTKNTDKILVRMGLYCLDTTHGPIVAVDEIEWEERQ